MITAFKHLRPFQLLECICLMLFAFAIPISWRIATCAMILLFVSAILKIIFEKGFNRDLKQYNNKIVYIIFIAFWSVYAISFFYSDNIVEARIQIGKKLSFLLLPIYFLCSDLSHLNRDRIKTIMYCFVCGILTLFIINLVWAAYDVIFESAKISRFYEPNLLRKGTGYIHHTYTSIYSCLGISFCFHELFSKDKIRSRFFDVFAIMMLILFVVLSGSRAGILCMVVIFIISWLWLTFVKKDKKIGYCVGAIIIVLMVIGPVIFNKSVKRLTDTVKNIDNVEKQDRRIGITLGYRDILMKKFWFGVGVGDRSDETLKSYLNKKEELIQNIRPVDGVCSEEFEINRRECLESINKKSKGMLYKSVYKYAEEMAEKYKCDYNSIRENIATYININVAIKSECNAHNQYSDTIIAVGIIGLILLLGFFAVPIYLWIKNKTFDIVLSSLLFIIAFNCLFESVFERQMGIMFFVFFYLLLFHANFVNGQQTTDNCFHP